MEKWKKLLEDSRSLRELLDIYLELRLHLKELGFSESDLDEPPTYTMGMMQLQDKFRDKMNYLLRFLRDYGFTIERDELVKYVQPLLEKINQITPLNDGDNSRNNTGDEDY